MCVSFNSTGCSQHPRYIWGRKWLDKEAKSPSSPCGYHVPQVGAPLFSGLKGRILTRNHGFCSEILGGSCSLSHHSILAKKYGGFNSKRTYQSDISPAIVKTLANRHVLRLWKPVSHVATRQTKIPGQMLIPHHIDPSPSMFFGSKSHSLYLLTFITCPSPLPTSVCKTSFQSLMCFMLTSTSCLQPKTKMWCHIFVKSNATPMAVDGLIQEIDQVMCLWDPQVRLVPTSFLPKKKLCAAQSEKCIQPGSVGLDMHVPLSNRGSS